MPASDTFCIPAGQAGILALRRSRCDGDLSVLMQSSAAEPETVTLPFPRLGVRRAWIGDHLDHAVAPAKIMDGAVSATVRPGSLATVLLEIDIARVNGEAPRP